MAGEQAEPTLRQDLKGWQVFFIVASVIIGEGVFSGDGQALETSGPAGTLLALFIISVITICVMEGVSEFVQLYPCPNAIVAYIGAFVDEDLAWACGIAYWYTYASIFAALNLTAANFTTYWHLAEMWTVILLYILAPIVLLGINLAGVRVFGAIESIGGILKISLVLGTGILMYTLSAMGHDESKSPIYEGFKVDETIESSPAAAVCWDIPVIAYSFIGPETVLLTAFEARSSRSLRLPSQTMAYFIFVLYMFTAIGEFLLIPWNDAHLPSNDGGANETQSQSLGYPDSNNLAVIAAARANLQTMPGFLNGCYIFSLLSASNSALYVASRTLYGLTRELDNTNFVTRFLSKFSKVVRKTGVPAAALLASTLAFIWLPFLHLRSSYSVSALLEILQTTGSVSCLIVWASLCLAFIRYGRWLKKCRHHLHGDFAHFNRDDPAYGAFTVFAFAQPIPAYIGMIGSIVAVFVLTTATWWKHDDVTLRKVLLAYAAPIILLVMWIVFKINKRRWWVQISDDFTPLHDRLQRLHWLKRDEVTKAHEGAAEAGQGMQIAPTATEEEGGGST